MAQKTKEECYREFDELGEEKVRENLQFGIYEERENVVFAQVYLKERERGRAEQRDRFIAKFQTVGAICAITVAAVIAAVALIAAMK
jgi:hypothetical protein